MRRPPPPRSPGLGQLPTATEDQRLHASRDRWTTGSLDTSSNNTSVASPSIDAVATRHMATGVTPRVSPSNVELSRNDLAMSANGSLYGATTKTEASNEAHHQATHHKPTN